MICKWCGEEIISTPGHRRKLFCSRDCAMKYHYRLGYVKRMIFKVAEKNNFAMKNVDKIARAKVTFFKNGDIKRCPCDQTNPLNYCGSEYCIADVLESGHCHCNLFHKKA